MALWIKDGSPGICARCHRKFLLSELSPDPNIPGLLVCDADKDDFDPYRKPQRRPENIALKSTSLDEPLPAPTGDSLETILEREWST